MIYEMRMADNDRVFMQLAAGSAANLKPELVMEAFCKLSRDHTDRVCAGD